METLMLLTYAALCIVVFKVFASRSMRTVPTAVPAVSPDWRGDLRDELQLPLYRRR